MCSLVCPSEPFDALGWTAQVFGCGQSFVPFLQRHILLKIILNKMALTTPGVSECVILLPPTSKPKRLVRSLALSFSVAMRQSYHTWGEEQVWSPMPDFLSTRTVKEWISICITLYGVLVIFKCLRYQNMCIAVPTPATSIQERSLTNVFIW